MKAPRQAKLVELKYFLGMSYAEVAQQLNIAISTGKADWAYARHFCGRKCLDKFALPVETPRQIRTGNPDQRITVYGLETWTRDPLTTHFLS